MVSFKTTVTTRKILDAISPRVLEKLHAICPENETFCVLGEIACIFSRILGEIACNLTKFKIKIKFFELKIKIKVYNWDIYDSKASYQQFVYVVGFFRYV